MTETTDIKALAADMRDLADRIIECQGENSDGEDIIRLYDHSDTVFKAENILLVLDGLEAERQQREAAEKDAKLAISTFLSDFAALNKRCIAAEAELAALRGEQEPDHYHLHTPTTGAVTYYPASQKEIVKAIKDELESDVVVTELFTRQLKPVVDLSNVLKVPYKISGQNFTAYDTDDLHAAIEAADIVVKDGE